MPESIIVTGAAGNLGTQIIKTLQSSYHILATVRSVSDQESLNTERVTSTTLDLTREDDVQDWIKKQDGIKGAVLTAGGYAAGGFEETDMDQINRMTRLNFETVYPMVRALLPVFEQNGGGRVILIGARPAIQAEAGAGPVAARRR
jgi:short-subunit dehydrogenase